MLEGTGTPGGPQVPKLSRGYPPKALSMDSDARFIAAAHDYAEAAQLCRQTTKTNLQRTKAMRKLQK
jgi:hypothetical protein